MIQSSHLSPPFKICIIFLSLQRLELGSVAPPHQTTDQVVERMRSHRNNKTRRQNRCVTVDYTDDRRPARNARTCVRQSNDDQDSVYSSSHQHRGNQNGFTKLQKNTFFRSRDEVNRR